MTPYHPLCYWFQERNSGKPTATNKLNISSGPIKNGHIPSAAERELSGIKDIQRGKTFLEARSAVEKHIEKMLTNNNQPNTSPTTNGLIPSSTPSSHTPDSRKIEAIKHSMHGVSHAIPGEMDGIEKPLPVHYGIDQAIRSGSVALKSGRRQEFMSTESLTQIVKEPSLVRGQSQDSIINVRVTGPSIESSPISPGSKHVIPLRKDSDSSEGECLFRLPMCNAFLESFLVNFQETFKTHIYLVNSYWKMPLLRPRGMRT